ncbi:MAG: non-canonical purine NTP pyrophosphatase, RdgB/HAM1 family [Candidatus Fraserbacteria bacterium RBG_16_55_9]|uniref:dITP/XTP pyrophosphatase n=1 Tax=Fraserbacteria sp. (strain RBG_16_55_9) TaxID=1817864 RepID=A0A1F5V1F4_FRAXR|nr:MAG: non-canonical purine NTP pyrophosphatase, RdgB/HAM1 family [Candidatus Fraserbacteria bacterium RBG_16_55_9]
MKLVLGTKNQGKIREILSLLSDVPQLELLTFRECSFRDIAETGQTFRENALLKASEISAETKLAVLAEDSGLEVGALNGAPGILSARFAGEKATDQQNIRKLLKQLEGIDWRYARFVCVAVLRFTDGKELIAEGELRGYIAHEPRGTHGFGYDPVFIPERYEQTLGELGSSIKDMISHRGVALGEIKRKLLQFKL